jgi:gluconokinase
LVMGVTGSGKTTLGEAIAAATKLPFYDGDDFHPESNRQKLRGNIPLGDEDRLPWLELLARNMEQWEHSGGAVLACSALKKSYREILRSGCASMRIVYLQGTKDFIAARLGHRAQIGHILIRDFNHILDGQFRDLEEPDDAIMVPIEMSLEEAVERVMEHLTRQ